MKKFKTILINICLLCFLVTFLLSTLSYAVDFEDEEIEDELLTFTEEYEVFASEEDSFVEEFDYQITKDGVNYSCLSLVKEESDKNEKTATKTVTKTGLSTNSESKITEIFGKTYSYSQDGYEGTLSISDIDIETNKGTSYEAIDELDIDFENYSSDDLSNIEKTYVKNGTTYYLIDVDWEADDTKTVDGETVIVTYKGTMHYQTVVTKTNSTTYDVTVTYSGKVTLDDILYIYTAVFQEEVEETYEYNIYYYYDGILNEEETESGNAIEGIVIEAEDKAGEYILDEEATTTLEIQADEENNLSVHYVTKTSYVVPTVIVSVIGLILVIILIFIFIYTATTPVSKGGYIGS